MTWLCTLCRATHKNKNELPGACCNSHAILVDDIERDSHGVIVGCREAMRDEMKLFKLFKDSRR